jgi:hypothetical protein
MNFGVRFSKPLVPSLTDDLVVANNNSSDQRVWLDPAASPLSQLDSSPHPD